MGFSNKKYNILGLNLAPINHNSIINMVGESKKNKMKLIIYYANFNTINLINKDLKLKKIFNEASIVHPDGVGICLASKLFKNQEINNFNWTDNGMNFLKICEAEGWKIFFLGSTDEILSKAVSNVYKMYPQLQLVGFGNGFNHLDDNALIDKINSAKPDILWVGMGTPKQELWINENKNRIDCSVIQAVGDFFTFIAGEKKRGFKFFQRLGFEWLIRVIYNPRRYFKRYIIGIPYFVFLLLSEKIKMIKMQ